MFLEIELPIFILRKSEKEFYNAKIIFLNSLYNLKKS